MAIKIDPLTGERITDAPQIDPATGERVVSGPTPPVDISNVAGAQGPLPTPVAPAVNMRGGEGNLETIPAANSAPGILGAVQTGVHNFGARVANNGLALIKPLAHPIDTKKDILQRGGFPLTPDAIKAASYNPSGPDAGATAANVLGDAAFGLLSHQASRVIPPTVQAVGRTGAAMQDAGAGLLNSKFAPTMKEIIRGSNPGQGMLESGIGPTMTKGSLATKVNGATEAVGSRIGDAVKRADQNALAPPIQSSAIAPALTGPIDSAVAKLNGPFGTASTAPYETMKAKLGNKAPGATASIYGPNAPAEIAPSDLWKHIQNLDQNTRFNVDPEVESVNETRRDIRQGLRPYLEASDPTIRPLSSIYGNLLSAGDAIARTQGGFSAPKGLSSLIDSTIKGTLPITTGASGLYKMGGGLKSFATNAPEWMGGQGGSPATLPFQPKSVAPLPKMLGSSSIGMPGGADYTSGGFPGSPTTVTPPPRSLYGLPAQASAGDVQPMFGVKSGQPPPVPDQFAKMRVVPTKGELYRMGGTTLPPETRGLALPSAQQFRRLPSAAGVGEAQPMIGIRNDYPQLATPFARERVPATVFSQAQQIPSRLFTAGEGGQITPKRLELPAPPKPLKKLSK